MQSGPDQLRDWMDRRGLNQTETAIKLGVPVSFLSMLVNGHRSPGLGNAVAIERMTGIPVEAWVASELHEYEPAVAVVSANRKLHKG